MNMDRRPTFFILGAAKAGTTSLYAYLCQHPHIYLPSTKEPHFFDSDQNYSLGLQFYLDSYFCGAEKFAARGEATPAYFHLADIVAPRMLEIYPDQPPKIIVILRDPVQRAWSHYLHSVRLGIIEESFEQALEMERFRLAEDATKWVGFYSDGLYARQIKQWFNYIEKEHFLFLITDDLRNDPLSTVNNAYRFIGVDETVELHEPINENVASRPRNLTLMKFINRPSILKEPLKRIIPRHKQRPIKNFFQKLILQSYEATPNLNPETAALLQRKYTDDIEELETIINRDLSLWLPTID